MTWAQVWIKGGVWWLASQTGLRYKGGNGNHDRLTIGLPGLETVASYPAGGWCRAGSDRVEANRSARGDKLTIIANLFVPVSFIATVTAGGGLISRETTDQL